MKKQDPRQHHSFSGQCFVLWLICWVVYCACEFLMLMLFYRETMPHERDYSILFWTQHIVFAWAYYAIFTKPRLRLTPIRPAERFSLLRATGIFFKGHGKQLLLLAGCAVLYEVLQILFPDTKNLFSALLILFFPSAAIIPRPFVRTATALFISLVSLLLPHVLILYWRYKHHGGGEKAMLDD